jgi:hypothetical protein
MDIFDLDRCLVGDYQRFARSFTTIRAGDIREQVNRIYSTGKFWPEPIVSINPHFQVGDSLGELRRTRYADIPNSPGIYLIINASCSAPRFLVKSTGGWFKRKDPSYSPDIVLKSWIEGAHVVYVGMTRARNGLRGRLCQYFDFDSGKNIGHRGGRLLWHLEDSGDLLVRWRTCSAAEADPAETAAITQFKAIYDGRRPFANRNK